MVTQEEYNQRKFEIMNNREARAVERHERTIVKEQKREAKALAEEKRNAALKIRKTNRKELYKTLQRPGMLSPLRITGERVQRRFRRATSGVGSLLGAFGVQYKAVPPQAAGVRRYAGPGRPRGTYKYQVPIQDYKKLEARRKALFRLQAQKRAEELYAKGYTPEQVKQIQVNDAVNKQVQQSNLTPEQIQENYQKELEREMISPNTQMMLDRIRWIQTKGARDNARMQRIVRERRLINQMTDLLRTPSIFGAGSSTINIFDDTNNILKAENLFKENPDNNILRRRRPSILQTRDTGNDLKFF